MSGTGFKMSQTSRQIPRPSSVGRAILFILPSIVITVVSITLFSQLTSYTEMQRNILLTTVIAAIILSLLGMAGMQVLIYRIVESREYFADGAASRSVQIGMIYSIVFSIITSAIVYPYFTHTLYFSTADFLYFAALLFLFSSAWVLVAAFWASEKYGQVAVIFTISYIIVFILTYGAYKIDSLYAIAGYTAGTAVLFIIFILTAMVVFRNPKSRHKLSRDISRLPKLITQSISAIVFNILYVLVIFLDKIIIWVYQGITSGQGLLITGTYAIGSFLGLLPIFSVAVIAYFSIRTKPLVDERYNGTYSEIQKRIRKYKQLYQAGFTAMWLIGLIIGGAGSYLSYFLTNDLQVLQIAVTISLGSMFLVIILLDSAVLAIFRKFNISLYSALAVILFELAAIPFLPLDVWYCALGYMAGSFTGFVISFASTMRLFSDYEYNMFGLLLKLKPE